MRAIYQPAGTSCWPVPVTNARQMKLPIDANRLINMIVASYDEIKSRLNEFVLDGYWMSLAQR